MRARLVPVSALVPLLASVSSLPALERPGVEFPVYQFPPEGIPQIDGDPGDWERVPEHYVVGTDELWEDSGKHDSADPENLDVRVKVGWVKGYNRLYFLYEAYDDYWDFSLPGLKNDTFEIVVDGDLSGGPLIDRFRVNEDVLSETEAFFSLHGVHAQNYHIFTPHREKDWAMLWGTQQWLKELPFANVAQNFSFEPGEGGRYTLEFFVTVFDHASPKGPAYSTESDFQENSLIGLAWAIIDYDDVDSPRNNGFWNLSRSHTMYGKADELVAFRLMPLEESQSGLQASWSFSIVDRDRRVVAFEDESDGPVSVWSWDFGDGNQSSEQHPVHQYSEGGKYTVVLTVESEDGDRSRFSRVWDVSLP